MDATFMFVIFIWTLMGFFAGMFVHWWSTRNQRRLLQQYRKREQARRQSTLPIE